MTEHAGYTASELLAVMAARQLKDGQCVRLKLGEMSEATVFNHDPAAQARAAEEEKARQEAQDKAVREANEREAAKFAALGPNSPMADYLPFLYGNHAREARQGIRRRAGRAGLGEAQAARAELKDRHVGHDDRAALHLRLDAEYGRVSPGRSSEIGDDDIAALDAHDAVGMCARAGSDAAALPGRRQVLDEK